MRYIPRRKNVNLENLVTESNKFRKVLLKAKKEGKIDRKTYFNAIKAISSAGWKDETKNYLLLDFIEKFKKEENWKYLKEGIAVLQSPYYDASIKEEVLNYVRTYLDFEIENEKFNATTIKFGRENLEIRYIPFLDEEDIDSTPKIIIYEISLTNKLNGNAVYVNVKKGDITISPNFELSYLFKNYLFEA